MDLTENPLSQSNHYTATQPHIIKTLQVKMAKPILPQMTQMLIL